MRILPLEDEDYGVSSSPGPFPGQGPHQIRTYGERTVMWSPCAYAL
jgi:hypothetical protein